jgi:NAD(P)-dependent dehydrogenase (short-subunit alcohol dehydrogenase family)
MGALETEPTSIAVVTGVSGDLGGALARAYLEDGWRVFGADVRPYPEGVEGETVDVRDRSAVLGLAAVASKAGPVRVWINSAGIAAAAIVSEADPDLWTTMIDINLTGTFYGCAAAVGVMRTDREGPGGRIVNVGSISGQIGGLGMHPAYGASKAGVHALTKSYALEGAKFGVACNAVAPSVIEGEMAKGFDERGVEAIRRSNPMRRLAHMNEIVEVIRFLADERSSYVNGAIVPVNGGAYLFG